MYVTSITYIKGKRVYAFLKKRNAKVNKKEKKDEDMAIYALSIKHKAKGKGATAKAHAQYIQREGKYREKEVADSVMLAVAGGGGGSHVQYLTREGNYTKRACELEASWSGNLPKWANTPKEFWNAADTYERANGTVYTEIVISIPRELSKGSREQVVRGFVDKEIGERFPYTVAIHNPRAMDGGEQPHAHVMFSIRELDGIEREKELFFKRANPQAPELGGTRKSREWSDRERDRVNEIRLTWETLANRALEKEGHEVRIDRRSLEARGIDREPEPKMGPIVTQMLKRGQETEVGQKVIELRNYRTQEKEVHELEKNLQKEKARVYQFPDLKAEREREEQGHVFSIKREGKASKVSPEEKAKYQRTLDLVFTRFEKENGDIEFRWKRSGRLAFTDQGDTVVFINISETAVKAGLQLAKEKGWEGVEVTGSIEFRRENWVQGHLMGIPIGGYEPRAEDFALLEERKRAQEQKREQYRKQDEPVKERDLSLPQKDKTKEPARSKVVQVPALELEREFRREIIPALENAQRKTMDELRSLGYQGSPGDMYGAYKRWEKLPSDEELRQTAFERLGGVTYKQYGEHHKRALLEVAGHEKKLEALGRKEENSFLKRISPRQILEKRRVSEELQRAKNWRDAAGSNIEQEQLRLSTGRNKEGFQQTLTYLADQRAETAERRKVIEGQQLARADALTHAYALRRSLESLGTRKVRFILEQGIMPRPENPEQFKQELEQARALERRRTLGQERSR